MSRIHHYLSMLIFTAAVMLGVQIPNFVDQYSKRVDAHAKEVNISFNKYVEISRKFGTGSIEALIKKHENSSDLTFQAEAEPIRQTYVRKKRFDAELIALKGSFWSQAFHVLIDSDHEILKDTWGNYSANVPLNSQAVVSGLSFGLLASLLLELFWSLFWKLFKRERTVKPATMKVKRAEPYIKG
ncbi:MAG: DUF2937 family protein [Gammaproteobacteria bacterium]|nr:DUF2937 family protein [Gammaproteobacteria bacterium]